MTEHMRLIEFKVSNFQRIKAVRIRPDGHVVTIAGRNDQGKTSLLRAIWVLLEGKSAAPAKLIRDGEEECKLYGDFGEMKVTRTFTRMEGGGEITMSLKITDGEGAPIRTKPQATLDKWLGAYAFDPLSFAKAPPKVQCETLKMLVPGVNFDDIAARRKALFDTRTEVNRKLGVAKNAAAAIKLPEGSCPKAVDVSAQLKALEAATAANQARTAEIDRRLRLTEEVGRFRTGAEECRTRAVGLQRQITDLEQQLATVTARATELDASATMAEDSIAKMPAIAAEIETAPIQAQIATADQVRATRDLFAQRTRHEDEAEALEAEAGGLDRKITALDEDKLAAIAAAKLPIEGLSIGEDQIFLNDIPFEQAGTRVKIMTSAMIGMALNPKLHIMTIDEGSEIDKEGLVLLERLATERDYTIIIAKVDESGANGFIMEDGSLVPTSQAAE